MFLSEFFKAIMAGIIALIALLSSFSYNGAKLSKDVILNTYNEFIQVVSSSGISKDEDLVGNREFGVDTYVGNYHANYKNITKDEVIFGGTSLNRDNGNTIRLNVEVEKKSGNIEVISMLGNDQITLIHDTGEYKENIYVGGKNYYLMIKVKDFTGNIKIIAE